jgi:hypothetical protein
MNTPTHSRPPSPLFAPAFTFGDVLDHVCGEDQVAPARLLDHLQEPGLIDGQCVAVPGGNALCGHRRAQGRARQHTACPTRTS